MKKYLFFDNASTTKCCEASVQVLKHFAEGDFGNPSSSHAYGQLAAKAIRDARIYFGKIFKVESGQVIFTGSGTESDNLAVCGVALAALAKKKARDSASAEAPRVLVSAIEHPAVRAAALSLSTLGVDIQLIPVDANAQIDQKKFLELLTPATILVSIQRVNNIVGSILPVEELARLAKEKVPHLVFHTDAVQAFGRVQVPTSPSNVDLVSISAHKIEGPKGVGALIVLNRSLLKTGLRPLIWGGEQEGGFRAGTQNAGLIAGFHLAAERTLAKQEAYTRHTGMLRDRFREQISAREVPVVWNSPDEAVSHIINLSVPGYPSGPLSKLLEERGCLVSTGSACSSQKMEPDAVLVAMGLPQNIHGSAIRISLSDSITLENMDSLVEALDQSIQLMMQLLGGSSRESTKTKARK